MKHLLLLLVLIATSSTYAQETSFLADKILLEGFNSSMIGQGAMKDSMKVGKWVYWAEKEKHIKHSEGLYVSNKKMGNWKSYYPQKGNILKTKEVFKNDSLFKLTYFDALGNKSFEVVAETGLGTKSTQSINKVCFNLPLLVLENSAKRGITVTQTHQLAARAIAKIIFDNFENATINYWDPDHLNKESWSITAEGVTNQSHEYYMEKLSSTRSFVNDILISKKQLIANNPNNYETTLYYKNGKVKAKEVIQNNKKSGKWELFYETGKKKSVASYKNGILNGTSKEWDANGTMISKKTYKDGKSIAD